MNKNKRTTITNEKIYIIEQDIINFPDRIMVDMTYAVKHLQLMPKTILSYVDKGLLKSNKFKNEIVFDRNDLIYFLQTVKLRDRLQSKMVQAITEGRITYEGNPCSLCNNKNRYISNSSCTICSVKKGLEKLQDFELMAKYRTPEKQRDRLRKYRKTGKHKEFPANSKDCKISKNLKANYQLTLEEYNTILEKQGNKCAICGNVCSSGKRLAVDHNHNTGIIRSLLCGKCNMGIGLFGENISLLQKVIEYLKFHENK